MGATPVLLLVFNRPDTTAAVFEAIRAARPSTLYVAADGPREDRVGEAERCIAVRRIATSVDWPCDVRTLFRPQNLGCRGAVSSAIAWFFEHEPAGIILEDDCLPSRDFFRFCAELLHRFRDDPRIMSICGSCYANPGATYPASYYFSYYADVWGWATWRRAWKHYDRDLSTWPGFKCRGGLETISRGRKWHASYWTEIFDATHEGRIDTWDYQWIYSVIEQNGLACYPIRNLVSNLGYGPDAAHTVVADGQGRPDPVANLPHQRLAFPVVHPAHIGPSPSIDKQIEALRLKLEHRPIIDSELHRRVRRLARRLLGQVAARLAGRWKG